MEYAPIKRCTSFWAWMYSEWNFPVGWDGPYVQLRIKGFRIFGFSFETKFRLEG